MTSNALKTTVIERQARELGGSWATRQNYSDGSDTEAQLTDASVVQDCIYISDAGHVNEELLEEGCIGATPWE